VLGSDEARSIAQRTKRAGADLFTKPVLSANAKVESVRRAVGHSERGCGMGAGRWGLVLNKHGKRGKTGRINDALLTEGCEGGRKAKRSECDDAVRQQMSRWAVLIPSEA
jgi:hypothetical protein